MGSLNGFDLKSRWLWPRKIQTLVRFVCKSLSDFGKPFSISILVSSKSWVKIATTQNWVTQNFTIISKPPHILYPLTILMTLALLVASTASAELELFCSYNSGFSQLSIFMYYTPIGHRADERGLHWNYHLVNAKISDTMLASINLLCL